MNNYELYLKLIEIASYNPLDGYCMLRNFDKEYKRSDLYKTTKMSLQNAYSYVLSSMWTQLYFKLQEVTDITSWVAKFNNFIDDLDEDKVQSLLNKITSSLNVNTLEFEKGELQNLLNQMKSLV
jgi:hypothetical protein